MDCSGAHIITNKLPSHFPLGYWISVGIFRHNNMKFAPRRISRILLIVSGIFVTFLIARQQLTEKPQNNDSYDVGQSLVMILKLS